MLKTTQKLVATMAAAGLALTPIAAQANTRAGDSGAVYSAPVSNPGAGRAADGEGIVGGAGEVIAYILAGLWLTGIIVIIVEDDDDDEVDNQSPGAN